MTSEVVDGATPRRHGRPRRPDRRGSPREDSTVTATLQPTALAERYLAAWNETEPAARRRAVAEVFTEDARYVDPLADAEGRDAVEATIAAVQQQFPGFVFRLTGPADGHHEQVRFSWELGPAGGAAPIAGSDVALLDGTDRMHLVLGFLDRVPAS